MAWAIAFIKVSLPALDNNLTFQPWIHFHNYPVLQVVEQFSLGSAHINQQAKISITFSLL